MTTTPNTPAGKEATPSKELAAQDEAEAILRAEWLHLHNAPKDWIVMTSHEIATLKAHIAALQADKE